MDGPPPKGAVQSLGGMGGYARRGFAGVLLGICRRFAGDAKRDLQGFRTSLIDREYHFTRLDTFTSCPNFNFARREQSFHRIFELGLCNPLGIC